MRSTYCRRWGWAILVVAAGHILAADPLPREVNIGRNPVGTVTRNGGGSYTVIGGGNDTWDLVDEGTFVYAEVTGDFDLQVRVEYLEPAARYTKAGLMARESLAEDSRMAFERVTPPAVTVCDLDPYNAIGANDTRFGYRTGTNEATGIYGYHPNGGRHEEGTNAAPYPNAWLRLQRLGNTLYGYSSTNGSNWVQDGSQQTGSWQGGPLEGRLKVGLWVSRNDNPGLGRCLTARCEFRELTLRTGLAFQVCAADSLGASNAIRVFFSRPVGTNTALNRSNYWISPLASVQSASLGPTADTVNLQTDPLLEGTNYSVTVRGVLDQSGNMLDSAPGIAGFRHAAGYEARTLRLALNRIPGSSVDFFLDSTAYRLDIPVASLGRDAVNSLGSFEDDTPSDQWHENYSGRISGILNVVAEGDYRFACASDDAGRLFLGSDDQPITAAEIAREPEWAGLRHFATARPGQGDNLSRGSPPANISAPQHLKPGRYYLEYAYAEGAGANGAAVAWDAGNPATVFSNGDAPIDSAHFVPFRMNHGAVFYTLGPVTITREPQDRQVNQGESPQFEIRLDGSPPYQIQWRTNGVPVPAAAGLRLVLPPTTAAGNGLRVQAVIRNPWGTNVVTREAVLQVRPEPVLTNVSTRGDNRAFYARFNMPMRLEGTCLIRSIDSNQVPPQIVPVPVTAVSYGRDTSELRLSVSPDLLAENRIYELTLHGLRDLAGGLLMAPDPTIRYVVHGAEFLSFRVLYRKFGAIGGGSLVSLLADSRYPNEPTSLRTNLPTFEAPTDVDESYGAQLLGVYVAPQDGTYRFWMASDDEGDTWIATNVNPANKVRIGHEPQWNPPRQYATCERRTCLSGVPQETQSPPIPLVAGQRAYLEGNFKEGGGNDNYALAVTIDDPLPPTNGAPAISSGDFATMRLAPNGCVFDTLGNVFFAAQPAPASVAPGEPATFSARVDGTPASVPGRCYYVQWLKNGVPIPGATNLVYTTPPVTPADGGTLFTLSASNDFSQALSLPAALQVGATSGCYTVVAPPGYSLIANQVNRGANTLNEILTNMPPGATVYQWINAGQRWQVASYDEAFRAWVPANFTLNPGEGAFFFNPGPAFDLQFCGQRSVPILPVDLAPGWNLVSRQIPEPGTYETVVGTTPLDATAAARWNPLLQSYSLFTYFEGLGWLDEIGNLVDLAFPRGEPLFILATPGGPVSLASPPGIAEPPADQTVSRSGTAGFTVGANGTPPLRYQWRLNGLDIPGATNATLTLSNVQIRHAGSYSVKVENEGGACISLTARLRLSDLPTILPGDNFSNRVRIPGTNSQLAANNSAFTSEPGEPLHAGRPGGRSAWYTWTAPAQGIATFSTAGSAFDTLLAIYTGTNLASLVPVANDDDRGGFFTSQARFAATGGGLYQIAIDGRGGRQGEFVLAWQLDPTAQTLPVILSQPASVTVPTGGTATFNVVATGTNLAYRWFRNGTAIPGALGPSLVLSGAQATDAGRYVVAITNAFGRGLESLPAVLEIGSLVEARSRDKVEDLYATSDSAGGTAALGGRPALVAFGSGMDGFLPVTAGTTASHTLNNTGAGSAPGEPLHCGVVGGSSRWFGLRAEEDGVMIIDTIGAEIDTVLAVYSAPPTYTERFWFEILLVACDDNGAPDGRASQVAFNAHRGTNYAIAVDGVGTTQGVIPLHYRLQALTNLLVTSTNALVRLNSDTALKAQPSGLSSPIYRWRLEGANIPDATNRTLLLGNVQFSQGGNYAVVMRTPSQSATQSITRLTVAQMGYKLNGVGTTPSFSVTGKASAGVALDWATNLPVFDPVWTNPAGRTPFEWIDSSTSTTTQRSFRLRPWP